MTKSSKILLIVFIILFVTGSIAILVGSLFKVQHWSGGSLLLTTGIAIESVVFLVFGRFLFQVLTNRNAKSYQ